MSAETVGQQISIAEAIDRAPKRLPPIEELVAGLTVVEEQEDGGSRELEPIPGQPCHECRLRDAGADGLCDGCRIEYDGHAIGNGRRL